MPPLHLGRLAPGGSRSADPLGCVILLPKLPGFVTKTDHRSIPVAVKHAIVFNMNLLRLSTLVITLDQDYFSIFYRFRPDCGSRFWATAKPPFRWNFERRSSQRLYCNTASPHCSRPQMESSRQLCLLHSCREPICYLRLFCQAPNPRPRPARSAHSCHPRDGTAH